MATRKQYSGEFKARVVLELLKEEKTVAQIFHIDPANSFGEPPHVDVNRLRSYDGPLPKRKYPFGP